MSNPHLSQALQRIATRFMALLPDRLDQIEANVDVLSPQSPADAFCDLERELHNIAGTAPTLGLSDLGQAAREAERRVGLVRLQEAPRSAERFAMMAGAVHALRESALQKSTQND